MHKILPLLSRRLRVLGLVLVAVILLTTSYRSHSLRQYPKPNLRRENSQQVLELPPVYAPGPSDGQWCQERFGVKFLYDVRDHSVSYCAKSSQSFNCFWSKTTQDRQDAMCYGVGAVFDAEKSRFRLACQLRDLSSDELDKGIPTIPNGLTRYWYETGPGNIFDHNLVLAPNDRMAQTCQTTILVKREGSGNFWHTMMEMMSVSWTLDALNISVNPQTDASYLSPTTASSTQLILLDKHDDGPFFDVWKLFTIMPIRRLHQLNQSEPATNLIIPFAGGSNALWQGDWTDLDCRESALVKAFASRVLRLFNLPISPRKNKQVNAKFIHRDGFRKLINETELIESANKAVPHLNLEIVDFAKLPFAQQLRIVRETDLLIGVHGAGLTHMMFLPPGSAVVEILPKNFEHRGFRNLAQMLGHKYYRAHTEMHGDASGDSQWQFDAVEIEERRLIDLLNSATQSLYNNGMRTYDIV